MSYKPRNRMACLAGAVLMAPLAVAAQPATDYSEDTLTGDWGGERSELADKGISFRGDLVGEAMGVVDGGYGNTGARYAQQLRAGFDLDMGKLAGWNGGAFHFTLNDRRGRSTSVDLVGNRFPIQEDYGGQYTRLTEFSYDQTFNGGKSYFKAGFYAMGNGFGSHALLTNFVNAAFCAHPLAMSGNSGWYNYPTARWGGEFAQQVSPSVNLKIGWFQVNPNLAGDNVHTAFKPFTSGTTGSLIPAEVNWKPGAGTSYPGIYRVGVYYDTSSVAKKGLDTSETTGRHGAYLQIEQKLFSESADRSRGLTGFAQFMRSDRETAQIRSWYALGGVYQGIGSRSHDRIAVGYIAADINKPLLAARRVALAEEGLALDSPLWSLTTAEELWEASYSFQVNPWLMIRPDVQYIVNPGTFSYAQTDNALAVGVQFKITF